MQILFDILPLCLIPLLMFGGIVYGLVGLVLTVAGFWKFMLTLVLFNLTNVSVVLWLSIGFASVSVASLVGMLIMLFIKKPDQMIVCKSLQNIVNIA